MPPPLWLCVGQGNRKRGRKKREPAPRQLPGRLERTITPCRPSAPESYRTSAPAPAPAPVHPLRPCPPRPRRLPPPSYPLPPLPPLPAPPQPAHVSSCSQPRQRRPRPLEEDGCDDDWDDDGHQQQDDVVPVAAVPAFVQEAPIPVPPRPVLPRSPNRESPSPQRAALVQETAVIRVPPRPVLGRKARASAPASSTADRIEVPPRPRLPLQRGMGQTHAKRGQVDEFGAVCQGGKRQAATREEEQKRRLLEEEEVRRKEVHRERKGKAKLTDREIEEAATTAQRQERQQPHIDAGVHEMQDPPLVLGPQLLGSDSFRSSDLARQKQIEASLEELRQLRESERWKAIERQRAQDKPARTDNAEALGMRHPKGRAMPRSSSKPATRHTNKDSDLQGGAREMPRPKGVFLVRALDNFKGNMRFEHETKGNRKRKQLRFKLHDVIRVTSVNTEDGLYFGTLIKTGKTGWFPYYYVVHL